MGNAGLRQILDLGCGDGDSWKKMGVAVENCRIIGIDVRMERAAEAYRKYASQGWSYLCGQGESIPLADGSIDGVFCNVALPYMHIPRTLTEVHRVLVPGGWLKATLHTPAFTISELRRSFPRLQQSFFRVFVLVNGLVFHLFGHVMSLGRTAESCQTERGIRIALRRAGFDSVILRREGARFLVQARRA